MVKQKNLFIDVGDPPISFYSDFYYHSLFQLSLVYAGEGGDIYTAPTMHIHFSAEPHDRGGSKYTQNLSFVITKHLKLVSGQTNFLRHVAAAKVEWVVDFLLRFCLKIGCNFTFHEIS